MLGGVLYHDRIIILFSHDNIEGLTDSEQKNISDFCNHFSFVAGVSSFTDSFLEISSLYDQAKATLEIGHRLGSDNQILEYDIIRLFHMINLCDENMNLLNFVHPYIKMLTAYDQRHETEFSNTLKVYIHCQFNQTKSSKALHIQRSSLIYRLQKIEAITTLHLDDTDLMFQLYLSYKILDYMNLLKN